MSRNVTLTLLVADEEVITGGVETIQLQLLPQFARSCDCVIWVLPEFRREYFQRALGHVENVVYESFGWRQWNASRALLALTHRLEGMNLGCNFAGRVLWKIKRHLVDVRLRFLARQYRATHCFSTCIFGQRIPRLGLPTAGILCDINVSQTTQFNMAQWVREADHVFAISDFTRRKLSSLVPGYEQKMKTVPLAAPSVVEASIPVHAVEHVTGGNPHEHEFTFYYPASAAAHKGHLALFQACKLLSDEGLPFRLILTGCGTEGFGSDAQFEAAEVEAARLFFRKHIADFGSRVQPLGFLDRGEVEKWFVNCDCVVLPSHYEGFGLPLAEALARGVPAICSEIPPFLEQIELYRCEDWTDLFSLGDYKQLAAIMKSKIMAGRRPRIPPSIVRDRMSVWTWQNVAESYLDTLTNCH